MISALISRITILVFGTLYPAYRSYKAVKTKNVKEYVKWMMYWIVFALFTCVETFSDVLLSWLPFYYEIKIVFVIWLLSPATRGSSILYRKFVHPQLMKREKDIDEYIAQATDRGCAALFHIGTKGLNFAANTVLSTAIKGQSTLVDHLRRSYSMNDISDQPSRTRQISVGETIDETDNRMTEEEEDIFYQQELSQATQPHRSYGYTTDTRSKSGTSSSRKTTKEYERDVDPMSLKTSTAHQRRTYTREAKALPTIREEANISSSSPQLKKSNKRATDRQNIELVKSSRVTRSSHHKLIHPKKSVHSPKLIKKKSRSSEDLSTNVENIEKLMHEEVDKSMDCEEAEVLVKLTEASECKVDRGNISNENFNDNNTNIDENIMPDVKIIRSRKDSDSSVKSNDSGEESNLKRKGSKKKEKESKSEKEDEENGEKDQTVGQAVSDFWSAVTRSSYEYESQTLPRMTRSRSRATYHMD